MSGNAATPPPPEGPAEEPSLARELTAIPYEPLLPIEKTLIAGSLILGVVLLGILLWLSTTFFPVTGKKWRGDAPLARPAAGARS